MPADKPRPTLADYVTIVVSPALIIAMIVSLLFFLLAVLYRGEFVQRLHVILFFFTLGIVLVARIAMATGYSARAPVYGAILAVLVVVHLHLDSSNVGHIGAGLLYSPADLHVESVHHWR